MHAATDTMTASEASVHVVADYIWASIATHRYRKDKDKDKDKHENEEKDNCEEIN